MDWGKGNKGERKGGATTVFTKFIWLLGPPRVGGHRAGSMQTGSVCTYVSMFVCVQKGPRAGKQGGHCSNKLSIFFVLGPHPWEAL